MTADAGWPGLGFDPAPGDPAGAAGLATRLADTARQLRETYDLLTAVQQQRGSWTGEASTAFAARLDGLPRYLQDAQTSLQRAGGVLGEWQGVLAGLQLRAHDLEAQAVAARTALVGATAAERQARANPDFGLVGAQVSAEELPDAQRRVDAAQAGLDRAISTTAGMAASLQDLLRRAGALLGEHDARARDAADGVRRADDGLAPPEPAWYEQAVGWVGAHLKDIGDVAGVVSAAAATLALIPVLTPVAGTVALIAGGVAMAAHGAELLDGHADEPDAWFDVGGDVVGLIPGAKLLTGAATGARRAFTGVDGLSAVLPGAMDGFRLARPGVIAKMGDAGDVAEWAARGLTPALDRVLPTLTRSPGAVADPVLVAKSLDGVVNIGTQIPTINRWLGRDDDVAETTASGVSAAKDLTDGFLDHLAARAARAAAAS